MHIKQGDTFLAEEMFA